MTPKAVSVTQTGDADGWTPAPGFYPEITPRGDTRLTASVPVERLAEVHAALVRAVAEPLSFLYRQKIDRASPRPQGAPPRDFVALGLPAERALAALAEAGPLVYGDARCEVWIRGALGEQVVLDEDGLLYTYPDDPSFRDALTALGIPEEDVDTISDRDYVKHWFHATNDALEAGLIASLGLAEVPHRR